VGDAGELPAHDPGGRLMQPGILGQWDGERWAPIDDGEFTRRVNQILASHMAAALADPDVGSIDGEEWDDIVRMLELVFAQDQARTLTDAIGMAGQHTAKSVSGYLLERVTETKEEA